MDNIGTSVLKGREGSGRFKIEFVRSHAEYERVL